MLGIASGEPWPDGFVIWTRLAWTRSPRTGWAECRRARAGGLGSGRGCGHAPVVARGVEQARIENAHSVHVELRGLKPGREYFYRFRSGRHISAVGRTLTSPALHETPAALAMAFASCSQYEHGYFTAYTRLAEDHPDLVLHLGDYMYEYKKGNYVIGGGNPRDHEGPETSAWPATGSAMRSTRPTPICRPRTRSHRGWWSGTTTRWTTTGRTKSRRTPMRAS